ncbi:MAG TPA: histidine kinase [Candidatus Binatia bacterium]|nr:histidine kinase [Candidatus Binatia bacterium]
MSGPSEANTPSVATLERARVRQEAAVRPIRVVAVFGFLVVEVAGVLNLPHPGLAGRSLGVLLALIGVAAGVGGVTPVIVQLAPRVQMIFHILLIGSSAALMKLQPGGEGVLGCYIAVFAGGFRLPTRGGLAVGAAGLAGTIVAVTGTYPVTDALLVEAGVAAFYAMGWMSSRLREGQNQALQLAQELESSRRAQAEAVALAERQRLARDMHDVLAHSLSGLVLQLEGARLLAERRETDPELSALIDRALHLGRSGLAEARRAIGALRDDQLPGPELLPTLASEFERDLGVRCTVDVLGEERSFDSVARLTVYRVAQEALTNVRRHARPESVTMRLAYEPGGLRLTVEDVAPPGPAPSNGHRGGSPGGGYGITGMRERAELLGGRLMAGPTETGYRIELWVPG